MVYALKRLLKEPLLHFLFLGIVLFVVYGFVSKRGNDEPGEIVVTQGQIEHLAIGFAKTWQRPPTEQELAGLIRDHVREEVLYREALAVGLDKDDTVIRRRLRQKMEFISDDIAAQIEPTDADLNAYLQLHPDKFRTEPLFTFRQVYLDPQKHGESDLADLLAKLKLAADKADASELGDPLMLGHKFAAVPVGEVAKQFGESFAAALPGLETGQWQGPVASGFGVHLVFISERTEGRLPALSQVRRAVRREWDNDRRLEANENFFQTLLKRYNVTIERLEQTAESKKPVADKTN